MSTWNDFNDAEQQPSFELIPKGTIAPVRMSIKPGGFDDPSQGWLGGYATQNFDSGSVYLSCEFVILEGPFVKRKMWSNIGLYSAKGPNWANMGRTFIRAALNSARNIRPNDNSPQAAAARRIAGFHELDGLTFIARIDIDSDDRGGYKNVIKLAIEPDHPDYPKLRGMLTGAGGAVMLPQSIATHIPPPAPSVPSATQGSFSGTSPRAAGVGKPSWAQ